MLAIANNTKNVKSYFSLPCQSLKPSISNETGVESVKAYRDDVLWNFLCREDWVDLADLIEYWRIIDTIMDISLQSAKQVLQTHYKCQVRTLRPRGKKRNISGINHEMYRLEYKNNRGTDRELPASALLIEAIDLLKEEAEGLIRQR